MLVKYDRTKRHRLFECAAKPLDAFVAPNHLLRRIDQVVDFRSIASPLGNAYDPDQGRPAVPPELLVRALVSVMPTASPPFASCAARHPVQRTSWYPSCSWLPSLVAPRCGRHHQRNLRVAIGASFVHYD